MATKKAPAKSAAKAPAKSAAKAPAKSAAKAPSKKARRRRVHDVLGVKGYIAPWRRLRKKETL